MSVWRIASKPTAKPSLSSLKPTDDESVASKSLNALTKWLPAEAVAGYAALVAAAQPVQVDGELAKPPVVSWTPWVFLVVLTPVLVLLTSTIKKVTDGMWVRAGLSVPAFVLWSVTVPHSAWNKLFPVDAMFVLYVGLLAVVFNLVAEWLAPSKAEVKVDTGAGRQGR